MEDWWVEQTWLIMKGTGTRRVDGWSRCLN